MHNWHSIEHETAFRRQEWERIAAADARAALANPATAPRRAFPRLHRQGLPWHRLSLNGVVIAVQSLVRRSPGCSAAPGD